MESNLGFTGVIAEKNKEKILEAASKNLTGSCSGTWVPRASYFHQDHMSQKIMQQSLKYQNRCQEKKV